MDGKDIATLIMGGAGAGLSAYGAAQANKTNAQTSAAQLALQRAQMQLGATQLDPFAQQKQAQKQSLASALIGNYKPVSFQGKSLVGGINLPQSALSNLPEFSPAAQAQAAQNFTTQKNNAFNIAAAGAQPQQQAGGGGGLGGALGTVGSLAGSLLGKGGGAIGGGLGLVQAGMNGSPLGGALSGAQAGMAFGPVGGAIGAGVGALIGSIEHIAGNQTNKQRQAFGKSLIGTDDTAAFDAYLRQQLPHDQAEQLIYTAHRVIGKNDTKANQAWMSSVLSALNAAKQAGSGGAAPGGTPLGQTPPTGLGGYL